MTSTLYLTTGTGSVKLDVMNIHSLLNDQHYGRQDHAAQTLPCRKAGNYSSSLNKSMIPTSPKDSELAAAMPLANSSTKMAEACSSARRARPKYSPEQEYFIWYHRVVLAESWDVVLDEFKRRYHTSRPKSGLQCKFYRVLDDPKLRQQYESRLRSTQPSTNMVVNQIPVLSTNYPFSAHEI